MVQLTWPTGWMALAVSLFASWLPGQDDRAGPPLLAVSPDGKALAFAAPDRNVRIWDLSTFELLGSFETELPPNALGWLKQDASLIIATEGTRDDAAHPLVGFVERWCKSGERWQPVWRTPHQGTCAGLDISPDGNSVAVAGYTTASLLRTSDGARCGAYSWIGNTMHGCRFAGAGRFLVAAGQSLTIWDLERDGYDPMTERTPEPREEPEQIEAVNRRCRVASLSSQAWPFTLSSDGKRIYAVGAFDARSQGRSTSFCEIEVASGIIRRHLASDDDPRGASHSFTEASALCVTDSGKILVGFANGTIDCWNQDTGQKERTIDTGTHQLSYLAYLPHGNRLAIASRQDPIVYLWDLDPEIPRPQPTRLGD